jgi:hypothetical protein
MFSILLGTLHMAEGIKKEQRKEILFQYLTVIG